MSEQVPQTPEFATEQKRIAAWEKLRAASSDSSISPEEVNILLGEFIDTLQEEADARYPDATRDVFFNYELTLAYSELGRSADAEDALSDLDTVLQNMEVGQEDFKFLTHAMHLLLKYRVRPEWPLS